MSQEIRTNSRFSEGEQTKSKADYKIAKLVIGLLLDGIGMLSYIIPGLAEITDIIWAPIGAFVLSMMYKGTVGKIGGIVEFIEEIVPGLDFIPTFTLTWIYEYYISNRTSK